MANPPSYINARAWIAHRKQMGFTGQMTPQLKALLTSLGVDSYDMKLPETKMLPLVLHPSEKLEGVVYGRYQRAERQVGRGLLAVTSGRLMFMDRKPLYLRFEEIPFGLVSGINYSRVALMAYVTVHTRVGDFIIRTFNRRCAETFVEGLEPHIFRA